MEWYSKVKTAAWWTVHQMFPNPESLPGNSTGIKRKTNPSCLAILSQTETKIIQDCFYCVTVWIHVGSIRKACLFCLIDKITNTNHEVFYLSTLQALIRVERQCTSILHSHSLQKQSVEVPGIRTLLQQNLCILSEKFNHSKERFITPQK